MVLFFVAYFEPPLVLTYTLSHVWYTEDMKLVLCSEGFHTSNTVQACVDLVGKPQDQISIAVINEAYAAEDGDKYWVLDNLNDVAKNFKGGMDIVNLLALPIDKVEAAIMKRDVIFVIGGHTDYLMSVFNKTGFTKLLPKLLETKVYVGSSAGSMVAGKRLSTAAHTMIYGDSEADDYGTDTFLEFVDVSLMPHLDSSFFPNRKETLLVAAKHHKGTVLGLRDDSALVVDGEHQTVIGSEPVKIVDGVIA
jgi:dipeptidase E